MLGYDMYAMLRNAMLGDVKLLSYATPSYAIAGYATLPYHAVACHGMPRRARAHAHACTASWASRAVAR